MKEEIDKSPIYELEPHVSCNVCKYGVDLARTGGGMRIRILQLSWKEILSLINDQGRDITGEEAYALADKVTENAV